MTDTGHGLALIAVMAGCTALLRFLPFIIFSRGTPGIILYLGEVLPYAVIAMLVVYCFRNTSFAGEMHAIPEILSAAAVICVHKWRHSMILSILTGTICYMCLIRVPFC